MRFARKSYITWFTKLPFRYCFRISFRDLPDTFRDLASSPFSHLFRCLREVHQKTQVKSSAPLSSF